MEQRTATAAVAETETGGSDSTVETPEIAARDCRRRNAGDRHRREFDEEE